MARVKLTLYVDETIRKRARVAAIEQDTSLSKVVEALLVRWLSEQEQKAKG